MNLLPGRDDLPPSVLLSDVSDPERRRDAEDDEFWETWWETWTARRRAEEPYEQ